MERMNLKTKYKKSRPEVEYKGNFAKWWDIKDPVTHSFIYTCTHSLTHSFTHSLVHSLDLIFSNSIINPLTHSLTQSFTHPLTNSHILPFHPFLLSSRWHHAYAVVLEHTVQRRRKMWSWSEIKSHRERFRRYKELYARQILKKKLGSKEAEELKVRPCA